MTKPGQKIAAVSSDALLGSNNELKDELHFAFDLVET
jgi:hypothetical protein